MDIPADALGFAVVFATLVGTALGVKFMVWGKQPLLRRRGGSGGDDERIAELEQRVDQLSEFVADQANLLEYYHERLDFTERMMAQQQKEEPKALEP